MAIDADEKVGRFDTLHPLLKQLLDGGACFDFYCMPQSFGDSPLSNPLQVVLESEFAAIEVNLKFAPH